MFHSLFFSAPGARRGSSVPAGALRAAGRRAGRPRPSEKPGEEQTALGKALEHGKEQREDDHAPHAPEAPARVERHERDERVDADLTRQQPRLQQIAPQRAQGPAAQQRQCAAELAQQQLAQRPGDEHDAAAEDGQRIDDPRVFTIDGRYLGTEVPASFQGIYIQNGQKHFKSYEL